jgi:hypothetical protein
MASRSTHLDTPIWQESGRPELVTVTDPAHPLHGRCFVLMSAASTARASGQVLVIYRDDVLVKIPAAATSLFPAPACRPLSKLSIDGIRDLVRFAKRLQQTGQRASANQPSHDCLKHDSESDLANSHGSPRGEP